MSDTKQSQDYNGDLTSHYQEVSRLIQKAKQNVHVEVNTEMVLLYWNIEKVTTSYFHCQAAFRTAWIK